MTDLVFPMTDPAEATEVRSFINIFTADKTYHKVEVAKYRNPLWFNKTSNKTGTSPLKSIMYGRKLRSILLLYRHCYHACNIGKKKHLFVQSMLGCLKPRYFSIS